MSESDWLDGFTHKDWLLDGYAIRGDALMAMWEGLDWSKAYVDMGPSPAGNLGPYWHVPLPSEETVHRLYPKMLRTKWLPVVRRAVEEMVAGLETAELQKRNADLVMENMELRMAMTRALTESPA